MADSSISIIDVPFTKDKTQFSKLLHFPSEIPVPEESISRQKQQIRPWLTFIQTSNFKAPQSISTLEKRITKNIEYFQANYVFFFLGFIVYCLIRPPPLMLVAVPTTFYIGYRLSKRNKKKKIILFGKELTIAQQYGILALCSMPVYYLVEANELMFWLMGVSIFLIIIHAAFYNTDVLISNEDDNQLLEKV